MATPRVDDQPGLATSTAPPLKDTSSLSGMVPLPDCLFAFSA